MSLVVKPSGSWPADARRRCTVTAELGLSAGNQLAAHLPPDAYKGSALPALQVLRWRAEGAALREREDWLTGLEVALPLPDLSMTFNALCLAGAAVAFAAGSVATVALRQPLPPNAEDLM